MKGINPRIKRFVLSRNPLTLEDTIKCVITEEENEKLLAEKGSMASLDTEGNSMEDKSNIEKSLEERIKNLEKANKVKKQNVRALEATNGHLEMECWCKKKNDCPTVMQNKTNQNIKCFKCQKIGHMAKDCRSKPGNGLLGPARNAFQRYPVNNTYWGQQLFATPRFNYQVPMNFQN